LQQSSSRFAGPRLGLAAAKTAVRNWVRAGARATEITWEDAEKAGEYLLKIPEAPIADALIAAQAARLSATVVSDDHHFRALGVRVTWYKR
jgi:PIN domain nuclease of toxin-antitoxin system